MRYRGQNFSLTFDVRTHRGLHDLSFVDDSLGALSIDSFNARHLEEYGHVREGETPEVTGVRLATHVETPSPVVRRGFTVPSRAARASKARLANLGHGYEQTNILHGSDLKPGHELAGPAIIEEIFTTIIVYPGWKAQVDDAGDYELTRSQ